MNEPDMNFVETATRTASRAARFAVERNIPGVLDAIRKQIAIRDWDDEDADTIDMTLKFSVALPGPEQVSMRIESVSWACRAQHRDTDFDQVDIDLVKPEIPGLGGGAENE